jgi:streptogramin lyase
MHFPSPASAALAVVTLLGSATGAALAMPAYTVVRAPSSTVHVIPRKTGHFTEYQIPTAQGDPQYIAAGPDGALWFTEYSSRKIGRITTSGVFTEYTQPPQSQGSAPWGIAAGPDGAMWFAGSYYGPSGPGAIGRITASGQLTYYHVKNLYPYGITAGPDGNMWFTADYFVGQITMSGRVTIYNDKGTGRLFMDIAAAPSGALYLAVDNGSNSSPYLGVMATPGQYAYVALQGEASIRGVAIDPASGNVWFTEGARYVGFMDAGGKLTQYKIDGPEDAPYPTGIAAGSHGEMWFTELGRNAIARITPGGQIEHHEVPTHRSFPQRIVRGPDGAFWFTESFGNQIGRYQP